jgi:response regulator RpfG family c-di-GMP phosphodiesterase
MVSSTDTHPRVLIVDDEPPIRRLMQSWVQSEGVTAVEAASAEQALTLIETEGPPAVALCDLKLPGHDGLWLAGQLHGSCPETAVVMTTAVHEFDAAISSLQAGVVDYLAKPFTRERLLEALNRALMAHQSRHALAQMQRELEQRRAQITEAMAELELNTSSSLEAMLTMLRARDPQSADHSHRVATLAVNLAMALQIGEPQLSDIERAALLHNLGRLAMPDDLLSRPVSGLSPADVARMRSYPLHGYAMLKNVPFLAGANRVAVAVHERFDGTGFPHGLKGDAIPLGARIICVANAYDELVHGMGQSAVDPERAIDILAIDRRSEFDPLVVDALRMLHPGAHAV